MTLYIKNMVTIRCIMVLKAVLATMGLRFTSVQLGEANIEKSLSDRKLRQLKAALQQVGLEIIEDRNALLIEKIRTVVIEMVHYNDELPLINYSQYISDRLNYDYKYLSSLFSQIKGITIEHFIILHKVEKIKELIIYDELNISEIANKMNYSSAAHLCTQFKKVTGLTPTYFKSLKHRQRTSIDYVESPLSFTIGKKQGAVLSPLNKNKSCDQSGRALSASG